MIFVSSKWKNKSHSPILFLRGYMASPGYRSLKCGRCVAIMVVYIDEWKRHLTRGRCSGSGFYLFHWGATVFCYSRASTGGGVTFYGRVRLVVLCSTVHLPLALRSLTTSSKRGHVSCAASSTKCDREREREERERESAIGYVGVRGGGVIERQS